MTLTTGRTYCMQLSVDAARWPDDMLKGYLKEGERVLSGKEVRDWLLKLKADGLVVVPCGKHLCEKDGRCKGSALKAA